MPCRVSMMLVNLADFCLFSFSDLPFSDAPRNMAFPTLSLELLGAPVGVADGEVPWVKGEGEGRRGEERKGLERNALEANAWSDHS
jgi:hypothetical protein